MHSLGLLQGVQDALGAASGSQYGANGEEDVYPPGAHAITHGALQQGQEGAEGDPGQLSKRTAEWVQDGEEEQDEGKKARLEGDAGELQSGPTPMFDAFMQFPGTA